MSDTLSCRTLVADAFLLVVQTIRFHERQVLKVRRHFEVVVLDVDELLLGQAEQRREDVPFYFRQLARLADSVAASDDECGSEPLSRTQGPRRRVAGIGDSRQKWSTPPRPVPPPPTPGSGRRVSESSTECYRVGHMENVGVTTASLGDHPHGPY